MNAIIKFFLILFFVLPSFADLKDRQSWDTQAGKVLTEAIWVEANFKLVTLSYTSCRAICPMVARNLKAIEAELIGGKQKISVLPKVYLISVDPSSDEAPSRKEFLKQKGNSTWIFLRGSLIQTRKISADLGFGFGERGANDKAHLSHTTRLALIDSQGNIVKSWDILNEDSQVIAQEITKAVAGPSLGL